MNLHVTDLGPLNAPVIMLIHGWSQCGLSFMQQHPLADTHRLIIPDLRGHGQSDKPTEPTAYDHATPWADDIKSIMEALNLNLPLLVGWSMGGWVVNDYIRVHGDTAIAGLVLVGSSVTTGKALPKAAFEGRAKDTAVAAKGMFGDVLAANLIATSHFVQACFAHELCAEDLAFMTGFNMLCPPAVRGACRKRTEDYRDSSKKITKPALVLWGAQERLALPVMGEEAVTTIPTAQKAVYENSGHAPFWEEADRFNTDLAAFADQAFSQVQGAAA